MVKTARPRRALEIRGHGRPDEHEAAIAGDCAWNLACDPLSPGGDRCPYDPDQNNCPAEQSEECVSTCHVPKGCDCFGCCTVEVDGVAHDIYLGDPDCALSAIDSCEQCTKHDDCDEACDPADCEVCFGMELPPGCDDPNCEGGMGCVVDDMGGSNCPLDMYCSTGCCVPLTTGWPTNAAVA